MERGAGVRSFMMKTGSVSTAIHLVVDLISSNYHTARVRWFPPASVLDTNAGDSTVSHYKIYNLENAPINVSNLVDYILESFHTL
jgi:hypothetical protein